MYKTIFLETNAINELYERLFDGIHLKNILSQKNFQPIVRQHTTYELARCFCHKKDHEKGVKLFIFLKELQPMYTCETEMLLRREILHLRTGGSVDVFIERNNEKHLYNAIENLTKNYVMNVYVDYINKWEENIEKDRIWDRLLDSNEPMLSIDFDSYVQRSEQDDSLKKMATIVLKRIMPNINSNEVEQIVDNLRDYPAIQTTLRAHLLMNYIIRKHKNRPAKDKLDDFRHIIDSSYSTIFITDDKKLTKYAKEIRPNIQILTSKILIED